MGWVDEAYRDAGNVFGKGADAMHITGDLSLTDFGTLGERRGTTPSSPTTSTPHTRARSSSRSGEKSYAVESATARHRRHRRAAVQPAHQRDIATIRRVAGTCSIDGAGTSGRWREPVGKAVPTYLRRADANDPTLCGRFFINSDSNNDYGTKAAFPSWMYPEDGNRFFPGTDASARRPPRR